MNEHPRQIWQAWILGQTVQFLDDGKWKDAKPNHYPRIQQPQCLENYWRIKSMEQYWRIRSYTRHLISAAPELLEALEYAVEALDSENPDIQLRAAINARAAIAKTKEEIKYEWT